MIPIRSSRWIHDMYWRPPATGPPTPSRNAGSIFCERAAAAVEHDARAHLHDAHAELRCSSQPRAPSPRTRAPGSRCRAARPRRAAPRRARRSSRSPMRSPACAGAARSACRPSTRWRVPVTRLSRIACLAFDVHRWATFSPARCTTASRPSRAAAGAGSVIRSQRTASTGTSGPPPGPARSPTAAVEPNLAWTRSGSRDSTVTCAPRSAQGADQRRPDQPRRPRDGHAQSAHAVSFSHARCGPARRGRSAGSRPISCRSSCPHGRTPPPGRPARCRPLAPGRRPPPPPRGRRRG